MTVRARSKYSDSSSRTTSASRPSAIVVNPTRSANSTVTKRRSATGASIPAGALPTATPASGRLAAAAASSLRRRVPHSPQKRAWGGLLLPQVGHAAASLDPHSWQNLRPASLTVPHAGHCIHGM